MGGVEDERRDAAGGESGGVVRADLPFTLLPGVVAELGLETKEFFVLAEVTASPYPAELAAAALMIPKASVTVYVRNLVAKGFLRREIDDEDLRRHRLALTAEGASARDRALSALASEFDRRLERVAPRDRSELRRILLEMLGSPD